MKKQTRLLALPDRMERSLLVRAVAVLLTVFLAVSTLTGCARPQVQAQDYPSSDRDTIEYLTLLEAMRGQLRVARSLSDLGYFERSRDHVQKPVDDIFRVLSDKAGLKNSARGFLTDLYNWREYLRIGAYDRTMLARQYESTANNLNAIAETPQVRERKSLPVQLSVLESSLGQVAQHYRDAVRNGVVVNQFDFESARGLLESINEDVFNQVAPLLREVNPVLVGQMEEAIGRILAAIPTPVLSGITPSEVSEIETAIGDFNRASDSIFRS